MRNRFLVIVASHNLANQLLLGPHSGARGDDTHSKDDATVKQLQIWSYNVDSVEKAVPAILYLVAVIYWAQNQIRVEDIVG